MKQCIFLLLVLHAPLMARIKEGEPWFAGNIIAYYARNTPAGITAIEAYLYVNRERGVYNRHSDLISNRNLHQYQVQLEFRRGLSPVVDVEFEVNGFYVYNEGEGGYRWGDTNLLFGFQLLEDARCSIKPDLRILVGTIFPTGKYKDLDGIFNGVDGVGDGAYKTQLILSTRKIYYWNHPFNWTLNLIYMLSSKVNVSGNNVYTPVSATGEVSPGVEFDIDLAFEYKFNRPWGIGFEVFYEHQNSSSFQRNGGGTPLLLPSTERISLAPSIEYNPTANLNVIAGAWFSVAGRNATAFTSGVVTVYYQF